MLCAACYTAGFLQDFVELAELVPELKRRLETAS